MFLFVCLFVCLFDYLINYLVEQPPFISKTKTKTKVFQTLAYLVAKLPVQLIQPKRKTLIRVHVGGNDICNSFLVCRGQAVFGVFSVSAEKVFFLSFLGRAQKERKIISKKKKNPPNSLQLQQLRPHLVPPPRLLPQLGRNDKGQRHLLRVYTTHLVADDGRDLLQGADGKRQQGVHACGCHANHAGSHHQLWGERSFRRMRKER